MRCIPVVEYTNSTTARYYIPQRGITGGGKDRSVRGRGNDGRWHGSPSDSSLSRDGCGRQGPDNRGLSGDRDRRRLDSDGDGSRLDGDGDGSRLDGDSDGSRLDGDSDGSRLDDDGSRLDGDGDGSRLDGDGSRLDGDSDGSRLDSDGDGSRLDGDSDGSRLDSDGDGSRLDDDGSRLDGDGDGSRLDGDGGGGLLSSHGGGIESSGAVGCHVGDRVAVNAKVVVDAEVVVIEEVDDGLGRCWRILCVERCMAHSGRLMRVGAHDMRARSARPRDPASNGMRDGSRGCGGGGDREDSGEMVGKEG